MYLSDLCINHAEKAAEKAAIYKEKAALHVKTPAFYPFFFGYLWCTAAANFWIAVANITLDVL